MLRAGKLARLGAVIGGLAVCLTALTPGVAMAAGGPLSIASMLTPPTTFPAQYSCNLSAYGSGIPPVTLSATITVPGRAETTVPVPVTLKTTSVALPSSVLSQLSGVVSFDLTASLVKKQGQLPSQSVPLSGQNPVSGTLTGLPVATASSDTNPADAQTLVFTLPGTGKVEVPAPILTFTPHTSAAALSAITCTTTATKRDIPVTVTDKVIGSTGPIYKFIWTELHVAIEELLIHIPMTVTGSGNRTVGNTVTVRLVAGTDDLLAVPALLGATSVGFAADLPVLGAQPGKIGLSEQITDLTSTGTRASGSLRLTRAGTDRILIPEKFTFTFTAPVQGVQVPFAFTFTITKSPAPVGLTLKVAKAHPHPQPSGSPTPTSGGGQPQGSGTPSGAPGTGGGTGPGGGDMAVAAGGLAMVLSGGGFLILARRRRRNSW
jgi:hypothetical protein